MGVREFVTRQLRDGGMGSYVRDAEPVIAALEQREREQVDTLSEFAVNKGLTREAVTDLLIEVGMYDRPRSVPSGMDEDQQAALISSIEEVGRQLQAIREAAERNGLSLD